MIGLVLVMHGDLGHAFRAALEHVAGPQEQLCCLNIAPADDVQARLADIERALAEVDRGEGVLLLTDVFGSTPCRIATAMLERQQVRVVAGINLPMLIKLARVRRHSGLDEVVDRARAAGQIQYYRESEDEPIVVETGVFVGRPAILSAQVTIVNTRGLHARPSAQFVKCAEGFDADIRVSLGDETVGGTSIMGLLVLGAECGATLTITASGREAQAALDALVRLVESGFDEDEEGGGRAALSEERGCGKMDAKGRE